MSINSKRKNLIRVNTNITEELNEWLNDRANDTGISKSALILIALTQYREKQDVLDQMPELLSAMRKIEALAN